MSSGVQRFAGLSLLVVGRIGDIGCGRLRRTGTQMYRVTTPSRAGSSRITSHSRLSIVIVLRTLSMVIVSPTDSG